MCVHMCMSMFAGERTPFHVSFSQLLVNLFQLYPQLESGGEVGNYEQSEVIWDFSNSRPVEVYSQFGTISTKRGPCLTN